MKKRFVVHPGWVTSKNDGDEHFIGADKLMRLYKVDPRECVVFRQDDPLFPRIYADLYDNGIHLYPRYDGDYRQPPKNDR